MHMATFTIRGKNIEVTPALRDYVEKKVGKVTKYFDNVGEITVLLTVSKDRHIVEQNPTAAELQAWHQKSGLPLKRFFNTSGLVYKDLGLKDKLPTMSEQEQYDLLASNGMLVKRPLVVGDDFVLVGFKEAEWERLRG